MASLANLENEHPTPKPHKVRTRRFEDTPPPIELDGLEIERFKQGVAEQEQRVRGLGRVAAPADTSADVHSKAVRPQDQQPDQAF